MSFQSSFGVKKIGLASHHILRSLSKFGFGRQNHDSTFELKKILMSLPFVSFPRKSSRRALLVQLSNVVFQIRH